VGIDELKTRIFACVVTVLVLVACDSKHESAIVEKSATGSDSIWENSPYESTSVSMDLKQVSPRAFYAQGLPGGATENEGFISNAGVVITDEGVVVIDSLGTPSLAYLLLSKIRALTDKPIAKVILTHFHADHAYGLQVFKEAGAEVIAPEGAKEYLVSEAARNRLKERRESLFPWVDEHTYLVTPDKYINKKESFSLGGIEFVLEPIGSTHSQGDMTIHVVQENVLYAGDLIFEGRIPFVAGSRPENWIKQLSGLDASRFKVIVPGHGSVSNNPQLAINFTLGYLNFLQKHMSEAVENMQTFEEAYNSMDWTKYKDMPAFRANRMNAYYVYLALESASLK